MTLVGAVLIAVAAVLNGIGRVIAFNDFLDSPRTIDDARDVGGQPLLATATLIGELAPLALAAGLLLVSLNAMRVGLLTRFLGILGMISGALTVFSPFFLFAPFIQAFWLLSLGFLYLGTGRQAAPPGVADGPGRAVAESARARGAEAGRRQPAPAPDTARAAPTAEAQPVPAGRPHPASKKRKRKRRG